MVLDPFLSNKAFFEQTRCVWKKKSKVSVLMQVVPKENVYTQRIRIYMYTSSGGRQMVFIIFFFLPPVNNLVVTIIHLLYFYVKY